MTVTLGGAFENKTVTLPLVATGQGGATSVDFSGVPSELVFMPGETEKTFTVELTQDTLDDDDESITLSFGTLPDTVKSGGDNETATVTIRDDDDPEVDVEFGAAAYSAGEGGSATVEITLSANPERTVIIPLTKTDQGGISAADYTGVPDSVTFNTGETSKTFTFSATQDDLDDDDESVKLEFGTLPARVSEGTQDETTISIGDDDDPHVTVEFGAAAYSAGEGGSATVRITLSADPERTVVIPLVKMEQGGVSTADYSGVPTNVTFNARETAKTFTFNATQDDVDDDDESVKLSFGAMPDARVSPGTTDEVTLSIDDDDNPHVTVQFTQAEYTVVEGSNVGVRITLSADPERTVSIPIPAANQDGATSADYTVPASVTFDASEREKTVTFAAADDEVEDFGESVKLSFGTTLPDRITKGGIDETKLNIWQFTALDCTAALLCADVTFADRTALDWAWYGIIYKVNSDPASGITDDDFRFGGLEYTIHHIGIVPGIFPEMDNPWSRSHQHEARLWIDIGHGDARTAPSRDNYRDWTLYIDDVTLPLSQAHRERVNAFHMGRGRDPESVRGLDAVHHKPDRHHGDPLRRPAPGGRARRSRAAPRAWVGRRHDQRALVDAAQRRRFGHHRLQGPVERGRGKLDRRRRRIRNAGGQQKPAGRKSDHKRPDPRNAVHRAGHCNQRGGGQPTLGRDGDQAQGGVG